MYGWLITWSCWRKILVLKNTERDGHKTSVFPLLHWNNWNLIKRETRTFFCLVSRISTEKCKGILSPFNMVKCPSEFVQGHLPKDKKGSHYCLPFTCNLQQMHITLSVAQSINPDHTITIYQQGCQGEQIPRLELVMMSSNTWNRSFKSLVLVCACVCV